MADERQPHVESKESKREQRSIDSEQRSLDSEQRSKDSDERSIYMTEGAHKFAKRASRILAVLTVGLLLSAAGQFYLLNENSDRAQEGSDAKKALCTLVMDVDERIEQTERYLRETPNLIPGIKPQQIRVNLENQKRTSAAIHSQVNCNASSK